VPLTGRDGSTPFSRITKPLEISDFCAADRGAVALPRSIRRAAEGAAPRKLQEWMGHADLKTTQIYTDYEPNDDERELVGKAFSGVDLSSHKA